MVHASNCYELRYQDSRFHLFFFLGRSPQVLAGRAGLRLAAQVVDVDYGHLVFTPA
jgi:hypothetical protein